MAGDSDRLTGSSGQDWFCSDLTYDRATDLRNEIFANNSGPLPGYHWGPGIPTGIRPVYQDPMSSSPPWLHQYEQASIRPQPPTSYNLQERAVDALFTSGWLDR